eukprot:m.200282 g.200282  ORF g.200282 m.200282 type:complete len:53 (+) comp13708_c2_seq4:1368-1526(+)
MINVDMWCCGVVNCRKTVDQDCLDDGHQLIGQNEISNVLVDERKNKKKEERR